LIKGEIRI